MSINNLNFSSCNDGLSTSYSFKDYCEEKNFNPKDIKYRTAYLSESERLKDFGKELIKKLFGDVPLKEFKQKS